MKLTEFASGIPIVKRWYFVSHLGASDRSEHGLPFEIQILNSAGQAVACGYLDETTLMLDIQGEQISIEVINAARRQEIGKGDYVDEKGVTLSAF